ncbi:MAG: YqgE/AlgH family protein [Candidatus Nanopelagicales bacterium]
MTEIPPYDAATAPPPAPGRLLVAAPGLTDPNFARTVVLLLEHDESGTLGVVLNRPTPVDVDEVLPTWRPLLTGEPYVFQGGPVALDSALGLASVVTVDDAHEPQGFRRVVGPVGLVDLDGVPEQLAPELAGMRIFVGYAGWSPGQLDGELAEGAWYVVEGLPSDAFTGEPGGLWREVLRRQQAPLAFVATMPEDPTLN